MIKKEKIKIHPSINFATDLKHICEPILALGITYFSHVRLTGNQFAALGMNPQFVALYLEKEYYNFDVHLMDTTIDEHLVIWDLVKRRADTKKLHEDFMAHGMGHTFSIIQGNQNSKNCYHFATNIGHQAINELYLQKLDDLKRFILYFNSKVSEHRDLNLAYEINFPVSSQHSQYSIVKSLSKHKALASELAVKRYYLSEDVYITPKELDCLRGLSQGKTIDETAKQMNVTIRTVKAHIANIKDKTQCKNLFQLGMHYNVLNKILK